jgi:hypothetical protein
VDIVLYSRKKKILTSTLKPAENSLLFIMMCIFVVEEQILDLHHSYSDSLGLLMNSLFSLFA